MRAYSATGVPSITAPRLSRCRRSSPGGIRGLSTAPDAIHVSGCYCLRHQSCIVYFLESHIAIPLGKSPARATYHTERQGASRCGMVSQRAGSPTELTGTKSANDSPGTQALGRTSFRVTLVYAIYVYSPFPYALVNLNDHVKSAYVVPSSSTTLLRTVFVPLRAKNPLGAVLGANRFVYGSARGG